MSRSEFGGRTTPGIRKTGGKDQLAITTNLGAYDNKLVSSSLSQTGFLTSTIDPTSPSSASFRSTSISNTQPIPHSHQLPPVPSFSRFTDSDRRPSHSSSGGTSGGRLIGGGSHSDVGIGHGHGYSASRLGREGSSSSLLGRSGDGAGGVHPSHPSSPWSILTLHVLPLFNGTPLMSPIEDLNTLTTTHLLSRRLPSTSQTRSALSSDLQELVSSAMLTLKAKLDSVTDQAKLVGRVVEVWGFFFGVIPNIQGIFLPLSLYGQDSATSNPSTPLASTNVRHLLLTGFLIRILLPLLPRLFPILTTQPPDSPYPPPTPDQLARLQHMSLILSTQAKPSSFFLSPADHVVLSNLTGGQAGKEMDVDESARVQVEGLLRVVVRMRMGEGGSRLMDMLGGGPNTGSREGANKGGRENRRGWVGGKRRTWRGGASGSSEPGGKERDEEEKERDESTYRALAAIGRREQAASWEASRECDDPEPSELSTREDTPSPTSPYPGGVEQAQFQSQSISSLGSALNQRDPIDWRRAGGVETPGGTYDSRMATPTQGMTMRGLAGYGDVETIKRGDRG